MGLDKPVRNVMSINFAWITPHSKFKEAIELMIKENVSFLPVLSERTKEILGVVEFFGLLKESLQQNLDLPAASAMITDFPRVYADDSLKTVVEKMKTAKKWYAVVVSKANPNKVVGVVSLVDIILEVPELRELALSLVDLTKKIKVESDEQF